MKKDGPDAVEIAQKQRHLHLLTRVRNNQPLSRAELTELNELEKMTEKTNKEHRTINNGNRAAIAEAEIIETQEAAALYVGRNSRTIRRWEKEGMLTAVKDGHKVYIKSQLKLFAEHEGKQPTKTKMKKDEGSADLTQTKAEIAKIDLGIKRGEWVRKEDINKDNVRKVLAVKSGIFALVRTIVAAVPVEHQRRIKKIADKEARRIIEGFNR